MSTDDRSPEAARLALQANHAAVCRHGPKGEVEVLCLATRVENGIWATVKDRGVYQGRVRGQTRGTLEVVDLYLHTLSDEGRVELPIRWATQTALKPIVLLGVPGDEGQTPEYVSSGELVEPEYQHIHVPATPALPGEDGFFGPRRASKIDFSKRVEGVKGSIFGPPMLQTYRCGGDDVYVSGVDNDDDRDRIHARASRRRAVCVHGDMGRPHDSLLGAPVVDRAGRLAGVVIGAGQGFQYDHVGAYVPIDLLQPFVTLAKAEVEAAYRKGRHALCIDIVSHESTDVEWSEREYQPEPRRWADRLVKVVMPRSQLSRIADGALAEADDSHDEALADAGLALRAQIAA